MIKQEYLDRAMSYREYHKLLQRLLALGRTTGENQSETYLNYAKLNLQRMARLDKTAVITEELSRVLKKVNDSYIWIVLTEGWCGDAAQSIPVLALIEKTYPNISLKLLLRDENLDLMDQYLTESSRSIPKLICIKASDLKELFQWGPRPIEVQAMMLDLKAEGKDKRERAFLIQKWYHADKTLSFQRELTALIQSNLT